MNINLTSVLIIMCALATFLLNVKSIYSIKNITKDRRIAILTTRALLVILITLAAIGVSFSSKSDVIHTVFLIDRSSSILSEKENVELFINDAIKRKGIDDKVSIISFAGDVSTDYTSFNDMRKISLNSIVNENATNYEESLKRANDIINSNENGRVVLISDGLENQSDYNNIIDDFKLNNIEFKFVKINSNHGIDSQVSSVNVPKEITVGESFQIDLELYSTKTSSAVLRIYKGSEIFSEKEINLSKGKNNFTYKDILEKSGNQIYTAEIDMMGDYYVNNNKYSTMTNGIGSPRLLIVEDDEKSGSYIASLASNNGYKVDLYNSQEPPTDLKNLLKYQAIILSNVTLEETPNNFIGSLKTYVEDFGGGLFVTGGPKSYALGGYYKTELEEILPINMEMKRDGMLPSVSMVIIIDKSGSMDGSKMDMAKEAARKAVDAMKPNDSMGVLAFDDTRAWVARLTSTDEKNEIVNAIGTINSGGGTSILPALRDGIDELKTSNSKLKHIILLTDGQAESTGYDSLIKTAIDNEITISTIAVGSGSDVRLLDYIAREGMGRFYNVINPSNIPSIFTKETFLASKSYINEEVFTPIISSDSGIVRPLYNEMYDLMGYVSTSLKANSELILKTDKDEPLLASWNYGLGKTSAWTSDAGGTWSSSLLASDSGKTMFLNIINDLLISNSSEDINISTSQNGSNVNIVVGKENLSTALISEEIILIDKDGSESKYTGDVYNNQFVKANLKNIEEGLYIIKSSALLDGEKVYKTSPLLINYSSEYNIRSEEDVSDDMVDKFDGVFIVESSEVFTDIKSKVYDKKDFSDILIIIAIFVLILDIYIRRFRNDKLSSLIARINFKLGDKIKTSQENKLIKSSNLKNRNHDKLESDKSRMDDTISSASSSNTNSSSNYKKNGKSLNTKMKFKKEKSTESGDMDHLNRLLKAKEKRK